MTGALPLDLDGVPSRLAQQMAFLVEIDQLKSVLRQTPIADGSRRENTAEHSWQLAMAGMLLTEHANEPVDASHVVHLLLVHDLVEIYAGDTFIYASNDPAVAAEQEANEQAAADRLFDGLPEDQGIRLRALWDEFESKATPESRFAKSIDRLMPMLLNYVAGGGSWKVHAITADKTHRLIDAQMPRGSLALANYGHELVNRAVTEGILLPPADI